MVRDGASVPPSIVVVHDATSVVRGSAATGTVRFTGATNGWKSGLLTIEATSTNPNAILSVFGRTDFFMF
jgi:hypothetical protein